VGGLETLQSTEYGENKMSEGRVLAQAVLDVIRAPTPTTVGSFKVEVWGKPPHDYVRHYEILAKTDTIAAQEGIQRFVKEMETLDAQEG
jgi:hypothetical protein